MATPPKGKAASLAANEGAKPPAAPTKKKKPRDTSRESPVDLTQVAAPHSAGATLEREVAAKPKKTTPAARPPFKPPVQTTTPTGLPAQPLTSPPVRALAPYGVQMDVGQANQIVNDVTDAHRDRFGYDPTPGLIFDVLRAHALLPPGTDYRTLFTNVPASEREGRTTSFAKPHIPTPPLIRRDGLVVQKTAPGLPPADTFHTLHKEFPTVQMGMLPLPDANEVYSSLESLWKEPGQLQVADQGMTYHQAWEQGKLAQGDLGNLNLAEYEKAFTANVHVTTVKTAQRRLNEFMGTKLPVTGFINTDWQKALSNWMKTRDYFQRTAQFQAENAGFHNYGDYLRAFKAKRDAVKHHGLFEHFINALPIHVFASGSNPLQVAEHLATDPFANPQFSPSYPLHVLTRTAGESLDVVGGSVNQSKAYLAAGSAYVNYASEHGGVVGNKETLDTAKERARQALHDNPTWLRVFYPDLPKDPKGALAVLDQVVNITGDIILLRKPAFTGERVAAGDIFAAQKSAYLNRAGSYSYNYIKEGKLGRAAALLEGGSGAEKLVAYSAPLIKRGKMTREQFTQHLAELYATGKTTLHIGATKATEEAPSVAKTAVIEGEAAPLASLRSAHLVTPGKTSMAVRTSLRDATDQFDAGFAKGGIVGRAATDFTTWMRSTFSHAPAQGNRGYFDPKLPERVHDFILAKFGDAAFANSYESALVRARATGNIGKIEKLESNLQKMYYKKFSVGTRKPFDEDDPFIPMLETEAGSQFRFPSGNQQPATNPFDNIAIAAHGINAGLNKVAQKLRLSILAGVPLNFIPVAGKLVAGRSLFFKHMVGDTMRRYAGGDVILGTGLGGAKKEIETLLASDVTLSRRFGVALDRTTSSEMRYLTTPNEKTRSFETGDYLNDASYMKGAGAALRQLLESEALAAYRMSTPLTLTPLVDLITHNKAFLRIWKRTQQERAITEFGDLAKSFKPSALGALSPEEFAAEIFNRFKGVDDGIRAAGLTWDDALSTLRAHRGAKVDQALGDWISESQINIPVKARVEVGGYFNFDKATSQYIKQVMTFNRLNRAGMFKNVTASQFRTLKAAGWGDKEALMTAMDVAEKQVIYHMLDFANMLKVEQDLRWLSYFATKHRLYWKWVTSTFVRNPATAAAVSDIRDNLDDRGNITFPLFGHLLAIPAARLVWVPGKEYSEVAPPAQFLGAFIANGFSVQAGLNAAAGTFGNAFTRNDTSMQLLGRAALMHAGKLPTTYDAASKDLDPITRTQLAREINHFNQDYFADHGHFPSQAQAVRYALWRLAASEMWRANLPLPVLPVSKPNETHDLLNSFMAIADPQKRSKFLDDHPELSAQFGVSQDPSDYTHYRNYWSQYTQAIDQYHAARELIYQEARKTGMTPKLEAERHQLSDHFETFFEKLKKKDLAATPLERVREVNGEKLGLWGQQVSADPLVDPRASLTSLFPNIPSSQLEQGLPSELIKNAEAELRLLNDPKWVAETFPDPAEAKTRRRELLQFTQEFRSYPHDKLGQVEADYVRQHVNPYWKHVEKELERIKRLPSGEQDLAYAELRQWKDGQDTTVVVGGVKFPSPVSMAWENLPKGVRADRLAGVLTGSWDHLADYEKRLLGVDAPKGVSAGWADYTASLKQYRHDASLRGENTHLAPNQVVFLVNAEEKLHPGFANDWKFSRKPFIERIEATPYWNEMPKRAKTAWATVAKDAHTVAKALAPGSAYTSADKAKIRTYWKDYVKSDVQPIIDNNPALKRWLEPFMVANPNFLNKLPVK